VSENGTSFNETGYQFTRFAGLYFDKDFDLMKDYDQQVRQIQNWG